MYRIVLYATGAGRAGVAISMDGVYIARGYDCMDAGVRTDQDAYRDIGVRATQEAKAEQSRGVRRDDLQGVM